MRQWRPAVDLLTELVKKDLKTRYARPSLGFLWSFLSPLFMVVIFYVVFGLILRVKAQGIPFVLYLMSGVFPWMFFQSSVLQSTTSLMDNKNLIKESSFPHWLIPLSIVLANGINFLPSLGVLLIVAGVILRGVPLLFLCLPLVLLLYLLAAIGVSVIASILYVKWRDIKYLLETLLLALFYATPIFYSVHIVKGAFSDFWFNMYIYNPFVGMLYLFRIVILKGFDPFLGLETSLKEVILIPVCFVMLILWAGFSLYKKTNNKINDYLSY